MYNLEWMQTEEWSANSRSRSGAGENSPKQRTEKWRLSHTPPNIHSIPPSRCETAVQEKKVIKTKLNNRQKKHNSNKNKIMPNIFYFLLFLNFFSYFWFLSLFIPHNTLKPHSTGNVILQAFFLLVVPLKSQNPAIQHFSGLGTLWLAGEWAPGSSCMHEEQKKRENKRRMASPNIIKSRWNLRSSPNAVFLQFEGSYRLFFSNNWCFGDRITNHFMQIFDFFHYFLCGQKDTLF